MAKAALHKIGDIRAKTPDQLAELLLELQADRFHSLGYLRSGCALGFCYINLALLDLRISRYRNVLLYFLFAFWRESAAFRYNSLFCLRCFCFRLVEVRYLRF